METKTPLRLQNLINEVQQKVGVSLGEIKYASMATAVHAESRTRSMKFSEVYKKFKYTEKAYIIARPLQDYQNYFWNDLSDLD